MASLIEQEWLLRGTAVSVVVATVRGRAAPLVVPYHYTSCGWPTNRKGEPTKKRKTAAKVRCCSMRDGIFFKPRTR